MKPRSLAQIHPDHLLDQARQGALPPEQWQALGAHLASCPGCAWEQATADDFAREQASFADLDAGLDSARLDALVGETLARAGIVESAPAPTPAVAAPAPRRRSLGRWMAAGMVAAVVFTVLALPARDPARADPVVAVTDQSLDGGALGLPAGGDT
jgi:anti-sigma factor RsiW